MRKSLRTRIPLPVNWRRGSSGGKGEILPDLPIRPAGIDESNLFPGDDGVNAEVTPGFAILLKCKLGCKYGGNEIADLRGVLIQREGEAGQINFGHARKFHH